MGYTHYWIQPRAFTALEFAQVNYDVRKIIEHVNIATYYDRHIAVCGPNGYGPPIISDGKIALNGCEHLAHETFMIRLHPTSATQGWDCCKTNRKPYDVVVTACLTYLAHKWGFEVSSDGDVLDWEDGVILANQALNELIPHPLIVAALA